jgi:predicted nucleic acid-binding protein
LTSVVVLDTDFLSAFLKIDQMSLIRDFYPAARVLVPPAVYREVSLTNLVPRLAGLDWLGMEIPEEARLDRLLQDHAFHRLGSGEQEAIALAAQFEASVLLSNDNKARFQASNLGLQVINVPAFLLACKLSGLADRSRLKELVRSLQEKDHYGFRADVLDLLLA